MPSASKRRATALLPDATPPVSATTKRGRRELSSGLIPSVPFWVSLVVIVIPAGGRARQHALAGLVEACGIEVDVARLCHPACVVVPPGTEQAPRFVVRREGHAGHVDQRFEGVGGKRALAGVGAQGRDTLRKMLPVGIRIPEQRGNLVLGHAADAVAFLVAGWRRDQFAMVGFEPQRG